MNRSTKASVILVLAVVLGGLAVLGSAEKGDGPAQPIAFDHWIHVTRNEKPNDPTLECTDCHQNGSKSPHATIPNTSFCMGCHESIATDKPEVQKLADYHARGQQ